jgi:hypothetical protein
MEPVEPGASKRRTRPSDWIIGFAVAAVVGLGIAEESGPTMSVALGNQSELTLPAQAWQYGLWLFITISFGWFGWWIMSFGGRGEVTMREDGIWWLIGKANWYFYAYSKMERCELEPMDKGSFWRLHATMKPERSGDPAPLMVVTVPKYVDIKKVRDILQSAGVATTGW